MKQLTISAALGIALSCVVAAKANAYTFSQIGEINGTSNFISPVINNSGTVAFQSSLNGGGQGIFTSNGTSLTSIVDNNVFNRIFGFALNDGGTVAFAGELNDGGYVNVDFNTIVPGIGIFTSNGITNNTVKSIPRTTYPWFRAISLDSPSINNEGTVVFRQIQKPFTTILTSNGMTFDQQGGCESFKNPLINNVQTVTYMVDYCANGSAIIKNDEATKTIIADTRDFPNNFNFLRIGGFSLNNQGIAAFNTITYGENGNVIGNGIYTSDGNTRTPIVDINGSFSNLYTPFINDASNIVFQAGLKAGGEGIFTGADLVKDKVIATGDSLFGSTITNLFAFSNQSLNNSGQIAFSAKLADGRLVVVRAEPNSSQPKSVPENSSGFGISIIGVLGAVLLTRKPKDSY